MPPCPTDNMASIGDEDARQSAASVHHSSEKAGIPVVEDMNDEVQKQLANQKDRPAGADLSPEEVALSKRINRKMDFIMLPVLSLLYLFNGLDKGNVGNAETQGACLCPSLGEAPLQPYPKSLCGASLLSKRPICRVHSRYWSSALGS